MALLQLLPGRSDGNDYCVVRLLLLLCTSPMCLCREPRDAYFYKHIFIIQIYKIFLLPRFAREGAHPPPAPSPSRGLTARAVQILSSWCTPPLIFWIRPCAWGITCTSSGDCISNLFQSQLEHHVM